MRAALLLLGMCCLLPGPAAAGGFGDTFAIGTGTVVIANTQSNSRWVPVSVLLRYEEPASGSAEVRRVSQGHVFTLAACSFTNVSSLIWVPSVDFPFLFGDALVVVSSATNGVVQVLRRGE